MGHDGVARRSECIDLARDGKTHAYERNAKAIGQHQGAETAIDIRWRIASKRANEAYEHQRIANHMTQDCAHK